MASVELEAISKSFGRQRAVRDVTLAIEDRAFVVFVGPSGCGKSTLLRMIAGLEEIDAGEIRIAGKCVNDVPAADRGIAMVFQSYALYPHMSVAENMGFGLRMSGAPKAEVARKVAEAAAILQIEDLLDRRPRALSGGQRQRVAIGRAIVRAPDVFLFDEPLSNLDAGLRAQMRVEIARLHRALATTMVYVTHDQVEAMTLADRIVVLNDGRIEQQGAPLELYERPANLFVAGFLGQPKMNFITVQADGDCLRMPEGIRIPAPPTTARRPRSLVLGVRPDALALAAPDAGGVLPGTVEFVEHLGSHTLVHVRLPGAGLITAECQGKHHPPAGDSVGLLYDPRDAHLFAEDGDRLD